MAKQGKKPVLGKLDNVQEEEGSANVEGSPGVVERVEDSTVVTDKTRETAAAAEEAATPFTANDIEILERGFGAVMNADYDDPKKPLSPKKLLYLEAARQYSYSILKDPMIGYYENEPFASEMLEVASDTSLGNVHILEVIEAYSYYKDFENAEEVLEKAVKINPESAVDKRVLPCYLKSPNAERLFKEALTALGELGKTAEDQDGPFLKKTGYVRLLELEDKDIDKYKWVHEAIVEFMDEIPVVCLAHAKRFAGFGWYKDGLVKATQELMSDEDDVEHHFAADRLGKIPLEVFRENEWLHDLLLETMEKLPWDCMENGWKFFDEPGYQDLLVKHAQKYPYIAEACGVKLTYEEE